MSACVSSSLSRPTPSWSNQCKSVIISQNGYTHKQIYCIHTHMSIGVHALAPSLPHHPFSPYPPVLNILLPLPALLISNTQTYTQTHTRTKTSMCVHPLARSLSPSPLLPFFFVRVFLNNQLNPEAHSSCDHTSPLTRRFDITHTHTHIRTHMSNVYTHYSSFSPRHPVCSFPLLFDFTPPITHPHTHIYMYMYTYIAIQRLRTRSAAACQMSHAHKRDLVTNKNV